MTEYEHLLFALLGALAVFLPFAVLALMEERAEARKVPAAWVEWVGTDR